MNRRKFSAALLRCALASACAPALAPCFAQEAQRAPKPSHVFQEAAPLNGTATSAPEAFEFEAHGFTYHIKQNGNGWRKRGEHVRGFNLRFEHGGLERVYFNDYGGRLLLVCEVGEGESGVGFVTLLEQPSMRARWKQSFDSLNVGEPLLEGRHLYVTGTGFAGKLNLETGEFDWIHEDLSDKREGEQKHFNSFERPELKGETVLFRERPVYNPRRTLVLDKKSGKILRVE
ncbi:MAG: hypothetical protein ACJ74T_09490 [Pyrinomonadaceae bacterium]